MSDRDTVKIEVLDQDNYATWAKQMKFLLMSKEFWSAVCPAAGAAVPANINDKAVALIGLHVAPHHLDLVDSSTSAQACWTSLENLYKARSTVRQLQLRQELNGIKKEAGESVSKYLGRARQLWRELTACGVTMTEQEVVLCVLAGLPSIFDIIVTVLEAPGQVLTLETILPRLLSVEQRSGRVEEETKALLSKSASTSRPKSKYQGKSKNPGKPKSKGGTKGACYHCGEAGHFIRDCPKLKSENKTEGKKAVAFMGLANETATAGADYLQDCWVLDSGATRHMTPNVSVLQDFQHLDQPIAVSYGNNMTGKAIGKGRVELYPEMYLLDVQYVPGLATNLVSIKQATSKGITAVSGKHDCRLVF